MVSPLYLHHHRDFAGLLRIVGQQLSIDPALVEKDYWIMHCLYGLQRTGTVFQLKGGTSLSKGHGIIRRFSEDIDIRIEPPPGMKVMTGRNQDKPVHCESRKQFFGWLSQTIAIDGINDVQRDTEFDDEKHRNGGIRLSYRSVVEPLAGVKTGVLLEVGFDDVTPNSPKEISSWAYDYARDKVPVADNRATGVPCYHPGYTLIEKLQTVSTKHRQHQESGLVPQNFMRHYYDIYCLLENPEVVGFIGCPKYLEHKEKRFRKGDNLIIAENDAFLLKDAAVQKRYEEAYRATRALYYQDQPSLAKILGRIHEYVDRL